ncbi:sigma-54-dependent transcriptional regulator [Consotaella salsifontis]|uniref:Two-component system, NtrC family, C4-dicarboxylate transport response regulator DctD n=1 Tax=Consotaella salsifontis TaxID=1365950 RepID=A0A1T4MTP3_9HYPH|nr:sigma-54 dependent transcriptional regulator [Consotaella salsifontis]SJZ70271.1 two-component system, NtrC family, C4-dicarboxylate transport response regulator DctD [Consotaella salsifontis]
MTAPRQPPTVLFVDDDPDLREGIGESFELAGIAVQVFSSADLVLERVTRSLNGIIVTDIRMPGMDGASLMRSALEIDPALPVIVITGHGDVPMAVETMRDGAYDFIEKPFAMDRLLIACRRALEKRRLVLEVRALRDVLDQQKALAARLVGRSWAMERLRAEITALAGTDANVLIHGETGSGKEVVARALHDFSERAEKPFVAINCGALPADIIESELFGHEAGAFTGAARQRIGKIEHAAGGTVFLDEIESMPLDLQVKLLRTIEERRIERLGSNRSIGVDVRFVAATKEDLAAASASGRFRADLYYRLDVANLHIPPLRERRDDIPLLFFHLAREARARYRREIPEMTPEMEARLLAHDWPGNVRELRNVADRFVLGLYRIAEDAPRPREAPGMDERSLAERVDDFERAQIRAELKRSEGRLKPVYERLQISRKGLYDKMRRLGIEGAEG